MTWSRGYVACLTLLLIALLCAPPLLAQESPWKDLNDQVVVLYQQGKYAEAIPVAEEAVRAAEAAFGPDNARVATALNNLASLYEKQGRYAEAEPLYQRALRIDEKVLGPDHPGVATDLSNLATLYMEQGKFTEAEPIYQRALRIREKAFGPDHPGVASLLSNLASLYEKQGRYAEAEPLLQRALRIDEKALGPDHPDVAIMLGNLAVLYFDEGKNAEAEPLLQRALRIDEKALGPDHTPKGSSSGSSKRTTTPGSSSGGSSASPGSTGSPRGMRSASPAGPPLALVRTTAVTASVERYPNIEAPDTVTAGQEIAVQVSLTSEQISSETKILSGTQDKGKLQLQMAEGERQWTLTINLTAPGMEITRGGTNTAQITIDRDNDSTIAAFYLRAQPLDPAANGRRDTRILATLWHDGAFLARIARPLTILAPAAQPSVANQASTSSAPVAPAAAPTPVSPPALASTRNSASPPVHLDPAILPPDLTIIENRIGNTLRLLFWSSGATAPVEADIANPDDLHAWINSHFAQMSTLGRGFGKRAANPAQPNPDQLHALDYLNAFGAELYDRYAPQAFKKLFFDLLQRSLEGQSISIQIFSDDPSLPWELMRPTLPSTNNRMDFLGATFSIARWPLSRYGSSRPPQSLAVEHSVVVAPKYRSAQNLTAANQELATLKTIHGFTEVAGDYTSVRQLVGRPPQGIVHFAGHGAVSDMNGVPQFAILLEDSEMDPATWQSLGDSATGNHPLFFFNACDVGESVQFMNDVDGWAPALLGNGASGYIGALWPVRDTTAALFASTFYALLDKSMASGPNLSVASLLTLTRAQVFRETGDVTALAYVFYGDPKLVLTRSPRQQ
jgi:tetratricopeptide (TPR) repeat protein